MRNKPPKAKSQQRNSNSLKEKMKNLARNQRMLPRKKRRRPKRRRNWSRSKRKLPLLLKVPLRMVLLPKKVERKKLISSHQS